MASAPNVVHSISPTDVFPGPRAFKVEEAKLFFGRDREASQLTDLLFTYQDVLLYAQSGAGKTSLINARLVPELGLERRHVARVGGDLPPGVELDTIPNIFVYNLIASTVRDPNKMSAVMLTTLEAYFQTAADRENAFLVVDQLEEIFTGYLQRWGDRRPFVEHLGSLLKLNPALHLLFAIREEYLAALECYSDLFPNQLRIRYYLQGLREKQAAEAIGRPLSAAGVAMDENLIKGVVDSLRTVPVKTPKGVIPIVGEFVEPLHLQVVCQNLVAQLKSGATAVTKDQVATFGDVDQALADFYQRALAITVRESGVAEAKIRRWFDRELITPAGTRGIVFQGEGETAGLPNPAISVLARENMIRGERRAGALWYELTHDRFIDPIRKSNSRWREERGEAYRIAQRLEAKAADWDRMSRPAENLLNETELEEARCWISSPEAAEAGYGDKLQALVSASTAELQEKQQRQWLLEQQARSARGFRSLAIVLAAACVLALIAFAWGHRQQQRLKSVRLAAESVNQLATAPDRSVLLAMHATAADATPQAIDALNRSLHDLWLDRTLTGHADKVAAVAFSPVGNLLASGSQDHTAKIWDTKTWSLLRTLPFDPAGVYALSFSPDGTRLVTASNNEKAEKKGMLQIWDVRTGNRQNGLSRREWISGAVHHPSKPVIASVEGAKGTVYLWEDSDSELRELGHWEHGAPVNALAFSVSGAAVATAGVDKTVKVWKVSTCTQHPKCDPLLKLTGNTDEVMGVAFSPDGQYIASAGMDRTVRVWNVKGKSLRTLPNAHTNTVFSVAFDRAGRLVSASGDAHVKVWDPFSGRELLNLAGHTLPVAGVAFSPDGTRVASASWDHTVKVWDIAGHKDIITEVAFSPDGKFLATSSRDRTVKLWDAATIRELETLPELDDEVRMVTFSHNGTLLAATSEKTARIGDVAAKRWLMKLPAGSPAKMVSFNPRAPEVATGDEAGRVVLWQLKIGERPRTLGRHRRGVSALAFSPDGKWVASGAGEDPVYLWDPTSASGKPPCTLGGDHDYVMTLAFSPDGATLATGSLGGIVRVWDVAKRSVLPTSFRGDGNAVNEVAFSPNGQDLATASWDGTARIWNVATGQEKMRFDLHANVASVAFSPDGKHLALAGEDAVPRVYVLDKDSLMRQARELMRKLGRTLQPDECRRYFNSSVCPPMP